MKRIKCSVYYPWPGIEDDEYTFEVEDDATEEEVEQLANETLMDLVFNRISTNWEEIE